MNVRIFIPCILAGLMLLLIPAEAAAQTTYTRTEVVVRGGYYPATPYNRYERNVVRTYDHPRVRYAYRRTYAQPYGYTPYVPYGYAQTPYGSGYGYMYGAQIAPPVPAYAYVPSAEPAALPLSQLFLVTNVVVCGEDDEGREYCDRSSALNPRSLERCKPLLDAIVRKHGLAKGYQVVASFRKRASGSVEATVRITPLTYLPELTHRTLVSSADTSYLALAVLLSPEPGVE